MSSIDERGALEAVERILNRGGSSRRVVEAVLAALQERGVPYAVVRPANGNEVAVGAPTPGTPRDVTLGGATVGSLELAGVSGAFVERVATLISPYVPGASA